MDRNQTLHRLLGYSRLKRNFCRSAIVSILIPSKTTPVPIHPYQAIVQVIFILRITGRRRRKITILCKNRNLKNACLFALIPSNLLSLPSASILKKRYVAILIDQRERRITSTPGIIS